MNKLTQEQCDAMERRFNDMEFTSKNEVPRYVCNSDGSKTQNPEWENARYAQVIRPIQ